MRQRSLSRCHDLGLHFLLTFVSFALVAYVGGWYLLAHVGVCYSAHPPVLREPALSTATRCAFTSVVLMSRPSVHWCALSRVDHDLPIIQHLVVLRDTASHYLYFPLMFIFLSRVTVECWILLLILICRPRAWPLTRLFKLR